MTHQTDEIFASALRLSEAERIELAVRLIDSVDPLVESDVEQAWDIEIQRRLEEIRTGQAKAIPWLEARRMIMEK